MVNQKRSDLEKLPRRMRDLKVDERGYPVPWFVAWLDGKPEFRAMDQAKWVRAYRERLCWVCGQRLGSLMTFVVGPMCGINRTTSEPPSHLECAQWSARNCPFLTLPHMVRREDNLPENIQDPAGFPIPRNAGVALLWTTRSYRVFPAGGGGYLINIGEPEQIEWWAEGKPATRSQVEYSVDTGLPALQEVAKLEEGGLAEIARRKEWLETIYPAA